MINDGYYTISQYIESKTTIRDKIQAYQNLIDAMELKLLDSIGNSDLEEYQVETGQMKVRTRYRTVQNVQDGIKALEQAKQRYINRYNGRVSVLRGGNF